MSMWGAGTTGMTGMSGQTVPVADTGSAVQPAAGEAAKGMDWKKFGREAGEELAKGGKGGGSGGGGTGEGGSGSTLAAKRPIGEHPEAPKISPSDTPTRAGFARLSEIGPRQRSYGTP